MYIIILQNVKKLRDIYLSEFYFQGCVRTDTH